MKYKKKVPKQTTTVIKTVFTLITLAVIVVSGGE
jgi:hypothetical protein